MVKEGSKQMSDSSEFSNKNRLTMEDGMPKHTIAEQIQKMQDKADVISNLQLELRRDIHAFKLSRLQDDGASTDMTNTWEAHMVTVPNRVVREHTGAQNAKSKM